MICPDEDNNFRVEQNLSIAIKIVAMPLSANRGIAASERIPQAGRINFLEESEC